MFSFHTSLLFELDAVCRFDIVLKRCQTCKVKGFFSVTYYQLAASGESYYHYDHICGFIFPSNKNNYLRFCLSIRAKWINCPFLI